jgi:hypothetical protein
MRNFMARSSSSDLPLRSSRSTKKEPLAMPPSTSAIGSGLPA